jgi:uncharacterized OsmC-like protein
VKIGARETMIDGVNLASLKETVDQLRANPAQARFTFKVTNHWVRGNHSRATVKHFMGGGQRDESRKTPFLLDVDEPPQLLGDNHGPNPVEYVLVALSGCLTSALITSAAVQGVELRSVESRLEGDLDVRGYLGISKEVRNGYQEVRVQFSIDSDASDDVLCDLLEMAQRTSPVFDIVTNRVPVSVDFERASEG